MPLNLKVQIRIRSKQEIANYVNTLAKEKGLTKSSLGQKLFEIEYARKGQSRKVKHPYQNNITKLNRALKKCDLDDIQDIAEILGVPSEQIWIEAKG